MLNLEIEQKMDKISEEIFGTEKDPTQIPITHESGEKLEKLSPNWINYRLDDKGEPVSWVVVVPTTREIAEKFLSNEITEKEILDLSSPQDHYSGLYLCAAVTVPEYRRMGLAIKLMQETIESIPTTEDCLIFAWSYSSEGGMLINKLEKVLGKKINTK
jgi:hypothetical protein